MCRLMYLPTRVRPPKKALRSWFEKLEKSNGGHGNGYATARGGCIKGLKLTAEQCVEAIHPSQAAVIWHTRLISCGSHVDELCHPFPTRDGSFLVHNGHWFQGAFTAKCLKGHWSDTSVAALFIRLYGWKAFTKECDRGVWLHLTHKGVQVHYVSGSLLIDVNTGAMASESCPDWGDWVNVAFGTYGAGERPKQVQFSNWTKQNAAELSEKVWQPCNVGKAAPPRVVVGEEKSSRGITNLLF